MGMKLILLGAPGEMCIRDRVCTTAKTDEEARELLKLVGAPFAGR